MKQNIFGLLILVVFAQAYAAPTQIDDPYNTYQWNRKNALAQTGAVDESDWYEWWYYKVVIPETREAFFFTYGVVNPWDHEKILAGTKSTVQFGSFKDKFFSDQDFEVQDFSARYDKTSVQIANNTATDTHLAGAIVSNGRNISWELSLTKDWQFNAMGWAMSNPTVSNIYWYPAQAGATMSGWIRIDDRVINIENAPAYQDRNWGTSFPKWWTWLTSNHFKNSPGTVLAAGGGKPKAFGAFALFSGLCIGLHHEGKEYIFRTTDGDKVKFDIRWGVWNVQAENSENQRIEISAYAPPEQFLLLPFQTPQGPVFYDYQALLGKMTVKLYSRSNILSSWEQVALLETDEAGIEWGTPEPINSMKAVNFSAQSWQ